MFLKLYAKFCSLESKYNNSLIHIKSLSSGYLIHHILDSKVLARYLEAIADDMEDTAPDYEPVFTDIYQY